MDAALQTNSISVLAIDDDEFSHELLSHMFAQLGVKNVSRASNGFRALKALQAMSRPPDYLLLDIFMPDMDGLEFLNQLSAQRYSGKVILMSGGDRSMLDIARELATESGIHVVAAITKPMHLSVLKQLLEYQVPD